MPWSKMTDMAYSNDEKEEAMLGMAPEAAPQYPSGLCIRLTETELAKLGLDDDVDVGDMIDLRAFGIVTSVHKRGKSCCVEIQLEKLAVENEMTEDMDDDDC